MTDRQKQCLLTYLGYDTGGVDGIWGNKSRQATADFQKDYGLTVDGVFGVGTEKRILEVISTGERAQQPQAAPETGESADWWKDIRYFTREEFRCHCGGKYCDGFPEEPEETLVRALDAIRGRLGVPVSVSSGVRCQKHNAAVGGVSNSQHLYGKAADLHSAASPAKMKAVAEEVLGNTGGIGLYSWGIHVDTRATKSRWNG